MSQREVCHRPEITLVLNLVLINVLGWGGLVRGESGGVSKSDDSFVYELSAKLLMKSLPFLFLI